jgi:hypothetical protein
MLLQIGRVNFRILFADGKHGKGVRYMSVSRKITSVRAYEILDSGGNPTISVHIALDGARRGAHAYPAARPRENGRLASVGTETRSDISERERARHAGISRRRYFLQSEEWMPAHRCFWMSD